MQIEAHSKISEVLKENPELKEIFEKYNLNCLSCKGIAEETIEKAAINNGLDLKTFLSELNKAK